MKFQYIFIFCIMQLSPALALPAKDLDFNENQNNTESLLRKLSVKLNDSPLANVPDTLTSSTTHKLQILQLPTTLKPHDVPVTAEVASSQEPLTPAAQNYFSTYYQPHIPPLGHSRPYYQATEEPFIPKYLTQPQHKQLLQHPRQQTYSNYDPTLMGSGDFGILRGGTFYSNEELSYHQEDNTDFYYSEASNSHGGPPVTEGFIQKYTYPEEQFAQFRDFADLNTPADAAFSQYVVVYAAKNSTKAAGRKLPNNIFDQLQQIDVEKSEEARKRRKNLKGLSSTKRKLIKTKIIKKKLTNKSLKPVDDDPLLALS